MLSLVFVIKSLNPNVEAAFFCVCVNKRKVGLSFLYFSFPFLLLLLRVNTKTFGEISFSYASLSVWNTLPQTLRHSDSASSFKAALKTHLFNNYFGAEVLPASEHARLYSDQPQTFKDRKALMAGPGFPPGGDLSFCVHSRDFNTLVSASTVGILHSGGRRQLNNA